MGARGPLPKRSGTRIGHISSAEQRGDHVTKGVQRPTSRARVADPEWHELAQYWYKSLKTSGMADFFQDSDWAFAYSLADDLSEYKKSVGKNGQRSSMMLATLLDGMSRLGTTEGDRRRMGIELHEAEEADDSKAVAAINQYKDLLMPKKPA